MLRNRRFLRGLGIGLVAGVLVVQLNSIGAEAEKKAGKTPTVSPPVSGQAWTDDQLKEAARNKGKVLVSEDEYAAMKTALAEAEKGKPGEASVSNEANIRIYIMEGMGSKAVEEYLFAAGVIRDRLEFREKIASAGLEGKIKVGLYAFKPDTPPDEVITRITEKPKS